MKTYTRLLLLFLVAEMMCDAKDTFIWELKNSTECPPECSRCQDRTPGEIWNGHPQLGVCAGVLCQYIDYGGGDIGLAASFYDCLTPDGCETIGEVDDTKLYPECCPFFECISP